MARPKEFDLERALHRAISAFSQKGFAATSTDELMRAMEVGRQSMYDTFGDKRALFLKALEVYVSENVRAINVRAAFVGIQAASEHMKGGGRIILIGSITAVRTAFPGSSVYSMTKAALTGLVRGAAIDLAPRAITVNNVQPGPTATDMSAPHAEAVKTLIPLARMADVSEIAVLSRTLHPVRPDSLQGPASQSMADTSHN